MASPAKKLIEQAMSLSEAERLEVASEILASVDDPVDPDWDDAWATEIDRREKAAAERTEPLREWAQVRERIAASLGKAR